MTIESVKLREAGALTSVGAEEMMTPDTKVAPPPEMDLDEPEGACRLSEECVKLKQLVAHKKLVDLALKELASWVTDPASVDSATTLLQERREERIEPASLREAQNAAP